jgi:beta-glucosidase
MGLIAELEVPCDPYGILGIAFGLRRMPGIGNSPIKPSNDCCLPGSAGRLGPYGLSPWIKSAFLHPDYPRHVSECVARLAERFHGRITWCTSLNEPRVT